MERFFLVVGILCLVTLTLLLIVWDGRPRKEPQPPTVPAPLDSDHE